MDCLMFYHGWLMLCWMERSRTERRRKENELVNAIDFVRTSLDASLDCRWFHAAIVEQRKNFNLNIRVAVKSDFNIT